MKKQSIFLSSIVGLSVIALFTLSNKAHFDFLKTGKMVSSQSHYVVVSEQITPDWKAIEQVFNRKGSVQGDVFKTSFPRTDLNVKIDGVPVQPSLAVTSWIAFKPVGNEAVIKGDLVLLEKEVPPVIESLMKNSIDVTALHNHLIGETPKIMYLHVSGHGNPTDLAKKIKQALSLTKTPTTPSLGSRSHKVDWSKVESVLRVKGTTEGDVLHISVPRAETITEMNIDIPPSMGVATSINFQMVGKKAATTGDFVLIASEVNPVINALTKHGMTVTAVHNHMLQETPRIFYLHYWGYDEPEKLAVGLKEALNQTNSKVGVH